MSAHDELLTRGVVEIIGREHLQERLDRGDTLRIKLGIDPTSPNVHLGRSIPLLKLRDFQEAGHTVVFIVGDFTGVIGDTSDKDSERPMLSPESIEENKKQYFAQVGKLIDLDAAEFTYNSTWLSSLSYTEIGQHADCFSVADFIQRENIQKRLSAGKRVSLREVLYPLMQGYDSVVTRADVELGGTDQRFNLLAGRTLQEAANMDPQAIVMGPLIQGLDGRKMSSSWGNTINLNDEPGDMYGKVMSVRDELLVPYLTLVTRVPLADVHTIEGGLTAGSLHPKDVKMRLAREIVTMYHGMEAALAAEQSFVQTFQKSEVPVDVPVIPRGGMDELGKTLIEQGFVSSMTEWRQLVAGGAVTHLDTQTKITDVHEQTTPGTYRIGKKRFLRIAEV